MHPKLELPSVSLVINCYPILDMIIMMSTWKQNAVRRVKRAREAGKKIRAVNIISQKWLEYMYKPDGLCTTELAQHYQLLWAVREEMRQINNV
ncbi:hypothetical protein Glove_9g70 [Diversispora epigaea]|uniref:Uncharacterized protein n=1 Tax=Diversispora epigaea TaxID=1348612 RepID=A0A397JV45_9GLOM|nr:hypothetical protein Glove_9g70 [Diversispora epigaea]